MRWFPVSCFALDGQEGPRLERIRICETRGDTPAGAVEVEVDFSNGQRRWCFVVTPERLAHLTQAHLPAARLLMYGAPHMIVVSTLTDAVINDVVSYLDQQNALIKSTLPIDKHSATLPASDTDVIDG